MKGSNRMYKQISFYNDIENNSINDDKNNNDIKTFYNFENVLDNDIDSICIRRSNNNSLAILGDSMEVLKKIKPNTVDLIFANETYKNEKDFGNNKDKWDDVN